MKTCKFKVLNFIVNFKRGVDMNNQDIRNYAFSKGVRLWEISEKLGYSHEANFSRVMRHELSDEQKQKIKRVIDDISNARVV